MKRALIFISFLFIASGLFAQSTALTCDSHTLRAGQTYYEYTGVSTDTAGTAQDSLYFEVLVNKNVPVNVAVHLDVTRTGTTDDYEIRLQGKVFEDDTYASLIDSTAQTADVSLYHPDVEVDVTQAASVTPFYRYFRIVIGTDGTVATTDNLEIESVEWKFWER